jgi:hypothetical protein
VIPKRIEGATRHLGAPKDWNPDKDGQCGHLAILDVELAGGLPAMVSAWEPTPEEIEAINAGSPIYLRIVGNQHPPVWVWAEKSQ